MNKSIFFFILMICFLYFFSCKKEKFETFELHFTHTINNNPVQFNQLIYTNTAENLFQVNEVKYFISKLILIDNKKKSIVIKQNDGIHYVDCSLSSSLNWKIDDTPVGNYSAISFVFGLDENDNKSNRFVNPPENNFSWPDYLGGGYHYMQINGKFLNNEDKIQNINIHTGIGQLYDENNEIKQFVQNYFTVKLPVNFSVNEKTNSILTLNMEIQRWFDMPNLFNFNDFETGIMQNQNAQRLLRENGENVFAVIGDE